MVWTIIKNMLGILLLLQGIINMSKCDNNNNRDHSVINISSITVDNVINITDTLSSPIRLEINDEINIDIEHTKAGNQIQYEPSEDKIVENIQVSPNKTDPPPCCLVISFPKCDTKQCVIRRKKMCWNICTSEVIITEAPGFPKDNFPEEYIPQNWRNKHFEENITITLPEMTTSSTPIFQQSMGYYSPYPYYAFNNLVSLQYQPDFYYPSPAYVQSKPKTYWCPGPYCPIYMMYR